ncbi:MAG: hypothetical protein HRU40_14850 [Saprospiraceae bacterium]|nr:hypothetical protein [Saprospiraceae bacterium]
MGSKTKKFADILLRAMQSATRQEFDYLAFRKNLKHQSDHLPLDQKYQAAFQATAKEGVTLRHALQAARQPSDIMQEEGYKFRDVLRKQQQEKVKTPQDRLHTLSKEIEKKKKQIEQLQKEVATLDQETANLRQSAEEASDTIRETAADFQSALTIMLNQVQEDIDALKKLHK